MINGANSNNAFIKKFLSAYGTDQLHFFIKIIRLSKAAITIGTYIHCNKLYRCTYKKYMIISRRNKIRYSYLSPSDAVAFFAFASFFH